MAGKRKALSKRVRFEIFKRDKFTCRYCGSIPPQVVLEIDHVVAVVDGGTNDPANLVTACFNCNRGKGCAPLSEAPETVGEQIARRKELAAQLREINRIANEERALASNEIDRIGCYWYNQFASPKQVNRYVFGDSRNASVRRFLSHLPSAEILDAVDITFGRLGKPPSKDSDERWWKFFCGVCWNKIRDGGFIR